MANIHIITRSANTTPPRRQERANVLLPDGGVYSYDSTVYSGDDSIEKIKTYSNKPDQIKANTGWVYAANDRIADFFGSGIKWSSEDDQVLIDLLKAPNDAMTGSQFLYLHQSYLNLVGESYIVPVGINSRDKKLPAALHILPAHTVEYKVNAKTGDEIIKFGRDQYLENTQDQTQFYRDYRPDPARPYYGLSVVAAAAAAIDTDNKAKRYNQNFFANAARPSFIVETERQLSDDAYKRFKMQLNELHTGLSNAHKPLLLENGAKSKQLALTQRDMDFLSGRQFNRDEILAMFGMSPTMLGMIVSANRANMDAAEYNFAKYVMLGRARAFVSFLYKYLGAPRGKDEIEFEDFIPADEVADAQRRKTAVNAYQTINEVREEMGLDPVAGGDSLYLSNTLVKVGTENPADKQDKTKDDNQDDDPPPDAGGGGTADEVRSLKRLVARMAKRMQRQASETRASKGERRIQTLAPLLDGFEEGMSRALRRSLESQRLVVLDVLDQLESGTRASKSAEDQDVQRQIAEALDARRWDSALSDEELPVYKALIAAAILDSWRQLSEAKRPANPPSTTKWVAERVRKVASEFNDETRKQVVLAIKDGLANGETFTELRARVEQVFGGDATSLRIERTSRYEATRVTTQADVLAWADAGVQEKEWYTAHDARVCAHCRAMDGTIVKLHANFFDKGDTLTVDAQTKAGKTVQQTRKFNYESIIGPPLDPNCRCVLLPVDN